VSGGLAIARLFGIEIRVSFAWAILIAVVTVIGAQQAAAGAPQLASVAHLLVGGLVALGFLASVVAHELAHALVGRRRGVEARTIVLGFAGGLAPLSIEAGRPGDELAIAIAGPAVSLAIALLAIPVAMLAGGSGTLSDRFLGPGTNRAAAGWLRAKTGSLTGTNALAGVVTDKSGRVLAFSFISNNAGPTGRTAIDALAATLRSCGCST